jgi:hypothetical protein
MILVICKSMEDYTTDHRGDVGSWVRLAAMDAIKTFVFLWGSANPIFNEGNLVFILFYYLLSTLAIFYLIYFYLCYSFIFVFIFVIFIVIFIFILFLFLFVFFRKKYNRN